MKFSGIKKASTPLALAYAVNHYLLLNSGGE
jgi:hypothetical protein